MHPELSQPFSLGPATLVNGTRYPAGGFAGGARIDYMIDDAGPGGTLRATFGGAATFGAGSLQPQISPDNGVTWINYGAAITVATPVIIEFPRSVLVGFLVAGANITAANLFLM